jgi:molybdopterin-guanine dinucleotide biosynthesis protein A
MLFSAIILSGGRATRMNGVDKGLVLLQNNHLIQYVIGRLTTQVDEILINANREIATYQAFGYPVLQDETNDFLGPLAGFLLGLKHARQDYVLTVPCDSPLLPLDLAERLYKSIDDTCEKKQDDAQDKIVLFKTHIPRRARIIKMTIHEINN